MRTTEDKDLEATAFAMCLLMPEEMLRREVAVRKGKGPLYDHHVTDLANTFEVSETMMIIRLTQLRLIEI